MNIAKEPSTKDMKGTNHSCFYSCFSCHSWTLFFPKDHILDGMFFLRNHLSCRIGKDYGFLVLTIRMHNAKMIHVM